MVNKLDRIYSSESINQRPLDYSIYHYSLPIRNLGQNMEGVKILHLSDLHFNENDPVRIKRLEDLSRTVRPDMVLYTGDTVTNSINDFSGDAVEVMRESFREIERYFVLGSHDVDPKHVSDKDYVRKKLLEIGYKSVINDKVIDSNTGLVIGGTDDSKFGIPSVPYFDIRTTNILLTHKLDNIDAYNIQNGDLVLSGHIHDSEICLFPRVIDGTLFLRKIGDYSNRNNQDRKSWKTFGDRTSSHISPAFSRHFYEGLLGSLGKWTTKQRGATLINLVQD